MTLSQTAETPAPRTSPATARRSLLARIVKQRPELTISPLLALLLLAGWEIATHLFDVPEFVLPQPESVWSALVSGLWHTPTDAGGLWFHAGITVFESVVGLLLGSIVGALLGFALGGSQMLERTFYPFIVAFQALPKVALAPLLIIWFGLGYDGKVYITAIITFFPVLVSAIAGCHAVEPERLDLARSCHAHPMQIMRKIIIPSALPYLFSGLNVASALAVLGAVVGEFVGARAGLGMLLIQYDQAMQMGPLFAVLILLAAIGFAMNQIVRQIEHHYCFWAQRGKSSLVAER